MADEQDSDGGKEAVGGGPVNPLIAQIVRSIKVNLDGYAPDRVRVSDAAPPPDYAARPVGPLPSPDSGAPGAPVAGAAKTVGRDLRESLQKTFSTSHAPERSATSQDLSGLAENDVAIVLSDGGATVDGSVGDGLSGTPIDAESSGEDLGGGYRDDGGGVRFPSGWTDDGGAAASVGPDGVDVDALLSGLIDRAAAATAQDLSERDIQALEGGMADPDRPFQLAQARNRVDADDPDRDEVNRPAFEGPGEFAGDDDMFLGEDLLALDKREMRREISSAFDLEAKAAPDAIAEAEPAADETVAPAALDAAPDSIEPAVDQEPESDSLKSWPEVEPEEVEDETGDLATEAESMVGDALASGAGDALASGETPDYGDALGKILAGIGEDKKRALEEELPDIPDLPDIPELESAQGDVGVHPDDPVASAREASGNLLAEEAVNAAPEPEKAGACETRAAERAEIDGISARTAPEETDVLAPAGDAKTRSELAPVAPDAIPVALKAAGIKADILPGDVVEMIDASLKYAQRAFSLDCGEEIENVHLNPMHGNMLIMLKSGKKFVVAVYRG